MFAQIQDALSFIFIQRALWAGIFIALSCSLLGVFLVLRRFSLIGDGLAHVSFATIALGLLLNTHPLYVSIPLVMLASLGILKLTERANIYGDAAIGLMSSVGIATGVLLASKAGGFNVDLFSYLFGSILAITQQEVVMAVTLSIFVMVLLALCFWDLFSITFDEDFARVSGIKVKTMNHLLILLTSLTVVLGIKVVGTMLVSSLIIFPAITALQIARGFQKVIFLSALFSFLSVIMGIFTSVIFDLPTGSTIVMANFLFFVLVFAIRIFRKS